MGKQPIVQSVQRSFSILENLMDFPHGMSLADVSKKAALNKSTAHRLLSCLIELGYATQSSVTGNYLPTYRILGKALQLTSHLDVLSAAQPYLDRLSLKVGETVNLVLPSGTEVLYIYQADQGAVSSLRMAAQIGTRFPMYRTAVGMAMLAFMLPKEAEKILDASDLRAITLNTVIDREEIRSRLTKIRSAGYAVDNEENEIGVRCIAMPILDYFGKPVAAFSISAPTSRMKATRLTEMRTLMQPTLIDIYSDLGLKDRYNSQFYI